MTAATGERAGEHTERLQSLQVLRAFAALAVVAYHTRLILMQQGVADFAGPVLGRGWLGVNLFFVISGFTILHAHRKDIGRPDRAGHYLWRRFMRVYPVYWIFLTLYIAAAAAGIGKPDFIADPGDMTSAYLLVPLVNAPTLPLKVAWTLIYEVMFYALFLIPILNRKFGIAALVLWAVLIGVDLYRADDGMDALRAWNLYFVAGIAVRLIVAEFTFGMALSALAGAALTTAFLVPLAPLGLAAAVGEESILVALVIPMALVTLGSIALERGTRRRFPAWLAFLGDASYSIYLVHSAVISVIAELIAKFPLPSIPVPLIYAATALIATTGGVVAHLLIERPVLRLMRNLAPGSVRRGMAAG